MLASYPGSQSVYIILHTLFVIMSSPPPPSHFLSPSPFSFTHPSPVLLSAHYEQLSTRRRTVKANVNCISKHVSFHQCANRTSIMEGSTCLGNYFHLSLSRSLFPTPPPPPSLSSPSPLSSSLTGEVVQYQTVFATFQQPTV